MKRKTYLGKRLEILVVFICIYSEIFLITNMSERQWRRIKRYFDADPRRRFRLEGFHGRGGQGSVYKVKYVRPGTSSDTARALVLKIADPERSSDVQGLRREKEILMRLQGCKHIVRCRVGPEDPLAPAEEELGWAWVYLDQIENGTLIGFMQRLKEATLMRLPNRMLWTMFLCMIRSCIAMAWPRDEEDVNESTRRTPSRPTGLSHNDVHGGNIMFGSFMDHPEHTRTPILKLLDFGIAGRINVNDGEETGEQRNILDMGIMMATLIGMQTDRKYTGEEMEVDLSTLNRGEAVLSPASNLLEDVDMGTPDPFPQVNLQLRLIVAACMASDPNDRPSLAELENWILSGASGGASNYNNVRFERDTTIQTIVQRFIFDAS
ncbi:kinase-like domain-containing protein [Annulohypoxylon moriforme]|nr:kinase-like domain-containing protein [Annulohypoxylon moriforme]